MLCYLSRSVTVLSITFYLSLFAPSILGSTAATTSLIAHWNFNENGGDTCHDVGGSGHNGLLKNGVTWTSGISGSTVRFDGVNDYCQIPDRDDLTGMSQLTIEAWVYLDVNVTTQCATIANKWVATGNNAWTFQLETGNYPRLCVTDSAISGGNEMKITSASSIPQKQWSYIVAVYTGTDVLLYINGIKTANNTNAYEYSKQGSNFKIFNNTSPVYVGGGPGICMFPGKIDELRIHSIALSQTEIQSRYAQFSLPPTIIGYSYSSPVYTVNSNVPANIPTFTGRVDSFTVSPALPAGLSLNKSTGVISGKPTLVTTRVCSITAWNTYGASAPFQLSIVVNRIPVTAPEIIHIEPDSILDRTPTLSWNAVNGASSYLVLVAPDTVFDSFFVHDTVSGATNYTPSQELPAGIFYWKVASDLDTFTLFSSVDKFIIIDTNPIPSILAYWQFDSISGNSYLDGTGNGHNISPAMLSLAAGVQQNALVCSSSGFELSAANSQGILSSPNFSFETWVYPSIDLNNVQAFYRIKTLFANGLFSNDTSIADGYCVQIDKDGFLRFLMTRNDMSTTRQESVKSDSILSANSWYHVVCVYDGVWMKIYVNGRLAGTVSNTTGVRASSIDARIGCSRLANGTVTSRFFGKLDEMKVYNYALTRDEIASKYESLKPTEETRFNINVGAKNAYGMPGQSIWVPIYIANHESYSISSLTFAVNFDTAIVVFDSVSRDSGLARKWEFFNVNSSKGNTLLFSMGGQMQPITYGEGELVRCRFRIKQSTTVGQFSALTITGLSIDEGNNIIIATTTPSRITIGQPKGYGDVSGNGEVTVFDASKILQYVVGSLSLPDPSVPNFSITTADVSGDGTITSYDAALVFKYSLALIRQFPVETSINNLAKSSIVGVAAQLSLRHSIGSSGESVYRLVGSNLRRFIAGEFALQYNESVNLLAGDVKTTLPGSTLKSRLDAQNNQLRVAIVTSDDVDENTEVTLFSIVVPPNAAGVNAIQLAKVLVNEGMIQTNYPAEGLRTGNELVAVNETVMPKINRIDVNLWGLTIQNPEMVPVSLVLYDLHGRSVYSEYYARTARVINLDTKRFAAGLYLCHVKMDKLVRSVPLVIGR